MSSIKMYLTKKLYSFLPIGRKTLLSQLYIITVQWNKEQLISKDPCSRRVTTNFLQDHNLLNVYFTKYHDSHISRVVHLFIIRINQVKITINQVSAGEFL